MKSLVPEPRSATARRSGFTLLELLVVITVIAILLGFIGVNLTGGGAAAMGAAQRTVGTLLLQTRIQAIMNGSKARLLVHNDPEDEERYHRFLRVAAFKDEPYEDTDGDGVWDNGEPYSDIDGNGKWSGEIKGDPTSKKAWIPVGEGVFLPDGIYVVPDSESFGNLAITGEDDTWDSDVYSEWEDDAEFIFGGPDADPRSYAFISFTARGTTEKKKNVTGEPTQSYVIALTVAEPQPTGSQMKYRFTNPSDVVGLRLRPYGSYVLLESIHDF